MTPRVKPAALVPPPAPEPESDDELVDAPLEQAAEVFDTPFDVLDGVLAQLPPGEAVVNVMRRDNGHGGKLKYVRRIAVTPDFSLDTIRDRWGGGKFVLQFFGPDERGRQAHVRSVTVDIEGEPHDEPARPDPARGPGPGVAELQALQSGASGLVTLQLELATLKGMLAGLTQGKGTAPDPLEMMERLTTVIRNLQPATPAAPAGNPSEILAFAREAVGFAKEMAPGADESSAWEKLADKVGVPALQLIREGMAQRGHAGALPPAAPAAPTVTGGAPVNAADWMQLAPYARQLVIRAQQGRDPELAAEGLLEELEHAHPALFQEIAGLATQPNFATVAIERLALLDLRVNEPPIRAWLEQFAAHVAASFEEEQRNDDGPEPEPTT